MAEKRLYIGSLGPFFYDDTDTYPTPQDAADQGFGDGVSMNTVITDGAIIAASFKLWDTDTTHSLELKWNEDDSADRILNFLVGGGNRSLTLNESFTIGDGYNVTITALGQANTLTLNESLTIGDGTDITITGVTQANTLTMNESFTIGNGSAGTLTFSSVCALTVELASILNQDLTTDASPTFAGVTLPNAGWVGIGAALERLNFYTAGYAAFMGCNVGIGDTSPDAKLDTVGTIRSTSTSAITSGVGVEVYYYIPGDAGYVLSASRTSGTVRKPLHIDADPITLEGGNVGIETTAPGQIFDVNQGSGNMIADNYDTHSLRKYKESITEIDGSGFIGRFKQVPLYSYHRKPSVSAEELKQATLEKFGERVLIEEAVEEKEAVLDREGNVIKETVQAQEAEYEWKWDVWDELYPDEKSYHRGALWDCPNKQIKDFIDEYAENLRKDRRTEHWSKEQSKFGLIGDDAILQETFPEVVAWQQYEDEETPHISGIKMSCYVGMLHGVIRELVRKVENLEKSIDLN